MTRAEWTRRYKAYFGDLNRRQEYFLDQLATTAWESWSDEDPEEIALSDLHCMRSEAE